MSCIIFYLHVNGGSHIFRGFLCIHHSYKLFTDKEGVIYVSVFIECGVGRPFSNSDIPSFNRTSSFAIAKIIGIGFPTCFLQLFVYKATCLRLRPVHHRRDLFGLLCTFLLRCSGNGCGYCRKLLGEFRNLLFLFGNKRFKIGMRYFFGHNKIGSNISPVTIGFHKPDGKIICHRKKRLCLIHRVCACVNGRIACLTKQIQSITYFMRQQTCTLQYTNAIGMRVIHFGFCNSLKHKDFLNQTLGKKPDLKYTRIRV